MQKIKNIEFLRIIGCIAIILLHLFENARLHGLFGDIEIYDKLYCMTSNGQKAVDLFFIISGFFFALKFNPAKSIWEFLKHKFIRLYPVLIFGIITKCNNDIKIASPAIDIAMIIVVFCPNVFTPYS